MRRVRCPECDTSVKVPDDHERSYIRCNECDKKIRLDEDDDGFKEKEQSKSQLAGYLTLAAYAMTALAVLACVGVAFLQPAIAIILGVVLGVAVAVLAGVTGLVFWLRAAVRGESRFRALAPWLGLQLLGGVILISPIALHGIAKKAGWLAPAAPANDIAKGPGNADPPPNEIRPDKQAVNNPPPKEIEPEKKGVNNPPQVEKPLPLKWSGDPALDKTLADLADQDGTRFKPAINRLTGMAPNEHRAVVAQHLAEQLRISPQYNRTSLLRALRIWATAQEVPVLIQMLADQDINTRNETLDVLGKFKDERSVGPVVRCFAEFQTRYHGEQALLAMGPVAEKEVLALVTGPDESLRGPAIRILKDIGTQQSIPALEEARREVTLQSLAQAAIQSINARTKK